MNTKPHPWRNKNKAPCQRCKVKPCFPPDRVCSACYTIIRAGIREESPEKKRKPPDVS